MPPKIKNERRSTKIMGIVKKKNGSVEEKEEEVEEVERESTLRLKINP